jgi:hypothetical protein
VRRRPRAPPRRGLASRRRSKPGGRRSRIPIRRR